MSQTQLTSHSKIIQFKIDAAAQFAYLALNASGRALPESGEEVIPTYAECKAHITALLERAAAGYFEAAGMPRPAIAYDNDDVQGFASDPLFDCQVTGDGSNSFSVEFWLRLS